MVSFKGKYTIVSAVLILTIISIITLNLDNGTHICFVGEVIETRYSRFPTLHTIIEYELKPAPRTDTGEPKDIKLTDGIYREKVTYSGDQRAFFQIEGYYIVTDYKRPFTLYPKITNIQSSKIKSLTFTLTEIGISTNQIEGVTYLQSNLEIKGDYTGCFEFGKKYEIKYFGDILLNYTEIR